MYYLLDENKKPYKVTITEWIQGLTDKMRSVKQETINGVFVSTVFLGLDHNFSNSPVPIVFETMLFGKVEHGEYQVRCSTYEEALKQHEKAVNYVNSLKNEL